MSYILAQLAELIT